MSDFLASLLNICMSSTRAFTMPSKSASEEDVVEDEAFVAAKAVGTNAAAAAAAALVR